MKIAPRFALSATAVSLLLTACNPTTPEQKAPPAAPGQPASSSREVEDEGIADHDRQSHEKEAHQIATDEPSPAGGVSSPDDQAETEPDAPQQTEDEPMPRSDAAVAGYQAFEEGDYEGAIEHFSVALEESPLPTLYYYRGVAHEMAGRPEEAIADLSKCIELQPNHTRAMFSRHLTHRKLEQWEQAFADIKRAHELDSGDFRIANAYAQMLAESPIEAQRDAQLAVKIATRACELTEWEDPICIGTLAAAYRAAGDDAKADELAHKAQQLSGVTFDYDYDKVRSEIHEYFTYHFEKAPNEMGLREIVPGKVAVSVWTIDRDDAEEPNVIFTTGMSERPMSVPAESVDGPFAEVCMYLPADWPTKPDLEDKSKSWPWLWLRRVAHYPHEQNTWIGEYPSVFPVEGPLKPLGEGSKFTALLLVPNFAPLRGFRSDEGPQVNIITAMPIYTEEYELAKQENGIPKLFARFQEAGVSASLDPDRPNTALKK